MKSNHEGFKYMPSSHQHGLFIGVDTAVQSLHLKKIMEG